MADFLNQGWFTLELAWHRIIYELNDHTALPVIMGTIIILLLVVIGMFLTPSVSKRG